MESDQHEFSFGIFRQRSAVLDPIAAVHVNEISHRTNLRPMNVTADDSGHAVLATELNHGVLVIVHVFHRCLGFELYIGRERPVTEAEGSSDAIDPDVQVQNPVVERRADPIQQTVEMSDPIELMPVNHQITPAVRGHMNRALHEANTAKADAKKLFEKLIVIARDKRDAGLLAILPKQFLDQQIVVVRPKPFPAQLPSIDEISNDVKMFAFRVAQEVEKLSHLGVLGSQMNVRYPNGAIVHRNFSIA
jgi:hypothetical protein